MEWAMLTTSPHVPEIDVDALVAAERTLTVDVREPEEYAHGHVPGAVNVPQAELATRLAELPRDRALAIICQSGGRSLRSAQFLSQAGFERVASVSGGTAAWEAAGKPLDFGDTSVPRPRFVDSPWAHAGGAAVVTWDV